MAVEWYILRADVNVQPSSIEKANMLNTICNREGDRANTTQSSTTTHEPGIMLLQDNTFSWISTEECDRIVQICCGSQYFAILSGIYKTQYRSF